MRNKIFFLLNLPLALTLAIALSSSSAWAFNQAGCMETSAMLLGNCTGKSTDYGWNQDPEKGRFVNACQTAARDIFQRCTRETSCPAFLVYLNDADGACGSIKSKPRKDGCDEMFNQWKQTNPLCPMTGIIK